MFELLLDYLQIRFGNLDTCGQDVLDTDNDIRPVGICGNLAFNTGEIALDNTHPVAYNKGAIVEADTVGIQVHHEHEIGHLFVRNHKHGTGEEVFHIEKTHARSQAVCLVVRIKTRLRMTGTSLRLRRYFN